MNYTYWTKEQTDFLLAYYPLIGDVEIAEIMEALYPKGFTWTKKHIEKKRHYMGLKRTREQIVAIHRKNAKQGRYNHHKVWKTRDARPQGAIALWEQDGRQTVMVKWSGGSISGGRYERLSYLTWWLHYGSLPTSGMISYRDGNPLNCTIENLENISMEENARRNNNPAAISAGLRRTYQMEALRVRNGLAPKTKMIRQKMERKAQRARADKSIITIPTNY